MSLKIETIKTVYGTLTKDEQISLLNYLTRETHGLSKTTLSHFPPCANHILQIFGEMSNKEYEKAENKYMNIISKIKMGQITIDYSYGSPPRSDIIVFTCDNSLQDNKFLIYKTNRFDWDENNHVSKEEFLELFYKLEYIQNIKIGNEPLISYFK